MKRMLIVSALLAAAALPATAADDLEIPAEYQPAVNAAVQVGTQLYLHDHAAARASDELMSRKVFERDKRIRGWLTDIDAEHWTTVVTYIGEEKGELSAIYRVRVPVDRKIEFEALKPGQPLDESQAARWKARGLAIAALNKRKDLCSNNYNTVVLPAEPAYAEGIRVYMLAATTETGVVVAGGHFRYEYSADGAHLESERSFTKSCIEIPAPKDEKGKPVAFVLTHLLDPTPTEIHVFLGRLHEQSVYVTAGEMLWLVDGREIHLLKRDAK